MLIVAGCLLSLPGLVVKSVTRVPPQYSNGLSDKSIEEPTSRHFADTAVADLLHGRSQSLYGRMEHRFRDATPTDTFSTELERLFSFAGRPLAAEYKADETGDKFYPEGTRKPVRKFWYAVRTTKAEGSPYFLFVELVPDGSGLACTALSIVNFPKTGPPAFLR